MKKIISSLAMPALSLKFLPLTIGLIVSPTISTAATFVIEKNNQSFSIDGNNGAQEGQQVYLWGTNTDNVNQKWGQIDHNDGYYSYKKQDTNLCWDGGSDGSRRQAITLEICDSNNYDQHWAKIKVTSGTEIYRFEKRNAPDWSIDGNNGGDNGQSLYLWNSSNSNVNQQWDLIRTDTVYTTTTDALYLQHTDSGLYYAADSSGQLIRTASTTSDAQGFEKVINGSGYSLKAVGGDYDGMYSYEANGEERQALTASFSSAEVFFENTCGDDKVYFTSAATGNNIKNESDNKLSNGSNGNCDDDANTFTWVGGSAVVDTVSVDSEPVDSEPVASEPVNEGNKTIDYITDDGFVFGSGATFIEGNPDPSKDPDENFDFSNWKITYPDASELDPPEVSEGEFYTDSDTGAMVFETINQGERTSSSTKYSRTELREMVDTSRDSGTKSLGNNWVISEASDDILAEAGGINGNMKATVAVDHVSTTIDDGADYMLGRVIVGQIHASENEPFKVFYRKLPGNTKGSIYFNYEDDDGESYYEFYGSRDNDASDPEDGILLGEKWGYEVDVKGREMTVTITRENGDYVSKTITWSNQFDNDWFYFKAGNYNQNNGGEEGDYAQVSIFNLEVSHD